MTDSAVIVIETAVVLFGAYQLVGILRWYHAARKLPPGPATASRSFRWCRRRAYGAMLMVAGLALGLVGALVYPEVVVLYAVLGIAGLGAVLYLVATVMEQISEVI